MIPPLNYIFHLGFKLPKKKPILDEEELTGCFNWRASLSDLEESRLETNVCSLLPNPQDSKLNDESYSATIAEESLMEWCKAFNPEELKPTHSTLTWFSRGIRGLVQGISNQIADYGHFEDYWQECSERDAKNLMLNLMTKRPPFYSEESAVVDFNSINIVESMDELNLSTGDLRKEPLEREAGTKIVSAIFNLSKLGPPTVQMPLAPSPTRFFIVSNLVSTPFESEHHHAVLLISTHRFIVFAWRWALDEDALEKTPDSEKSLKSFISECIGR